MGERKTGSNIRKTKEENNTGKREGEKEERPGDEKGRQEGVRAKTKY